MSANSVKVPELGESITEAIVATWLKQPGEAVAADEPIVELETDKITVEVPAPSAGVLTKQMAEEGDTVNVGDPIAEIDPDAEASAGDAEPKSSGDDGGEDGSKENDENDQGKSGGDGGDKPAMPAARAEAGRSGVDVSKVEGSGRGGRVLKEDVQKAASGSGKSSKERDRPSKPNPAQPPRPPQSRDRGQTEERVKMTSLRKRIASRLVQAQADAAILTTFNECDMSAVMELRSAYKQPFIDRHDVKLGFMSFFIKAAVTALQTYPAVNAEIDGEEIVYHHRYDIGVAVGGGKGLVVPVIRDCDQLSMADIEKEILRLAGLARNNKLAISDLTGGTFTISNGGVYGSMLSTPILNPPQTGILGLHNIVERPVAVNGQVEIRPIMYLALSYDHRLVDGREAVGFLVKIKEAIEDPRRLLIDV